MSAQNAERERIIKEIKHEIRMSTTTSGKFLGGEFLERMMAWHLAEVKRIVEPLNKLGDISNLHNQNYQQDIDKAIELTLMRAGGE